MNSHSVTIHIPVHQPRLSTSLYSFAYMFLRTGGFLLLIAAALEAACGAQENTWAWIAGSKTANQPGAYGSQGIATTGHAPGARQDAALWADSAGNIWMFGGLGNDAASTVGYLNDLWVYDTGAQQWTWVSGSDSVPSKGGGDPGIYGALGQAAAANTPGGRTQAAAWTDLAGNLWLFGGLGYDAEGTPGSLNDLWAFNPSTRQWTWYGGSQTVPAPWAGVSGVYGTLGVAASANAPGGRKAPAACQVGGELWMFGGSGFDSAGTQTYLNDLWNLNPVTHQWTWVGGTSTAPPSGQILAVYGTLGLESTGDVDGGRDGAVCGGSPSLINIFGGLGFLPDGNVGYLNDFWDLFNPTSFLYWTWMGGSDTVTNEDRDVNGVVFRGQPGAYGTLGLAAVGNSPGGRQNAAAWTDSDGNLWMFGGNGFDANGHYGALNDLWMVGRTDEWDWMAGSSTVPGCLSDGYGTTPCGVQGSYGTEGIYSSQSLPGSRAHASTTVDPSGKFWLFGGTGYDSAGVYGTLNDLWRFQSTASLRAAAPTFSPPGGQYTACLEVTLSDATAGATIYFTTDGSQPTPSSSVYKSPIDVCPTLIGVGDPAFYSMQINAFAVAPGFPQSQESQAFYFLSLGPPNPPVLDPPPGVYNSSVDVTLFDSNGAKIYYTLGGSPPDSNSTPYTVPIHVTTNTTISAVACIGDSCSQVTGGEYDIGGPPAAIPTFTPPAGPYTSIQAVTISDSTAGAAIYFTTDGSKPTTNSTLYTTPITVASSETIEARAVAPGYSASEIGAAQYTMNLPPPAFAFDTTVPSLTINSGSQGSITLSVTPQNGFNSVVSFACSGLPVGASCTFSPTTVTPSGTATNVVLTIAVERQVSAVRPASGQLLPATLTIAMCLLGWRNRRDPRVWLLWMVIAVGLGMLSACGGGGRKTTPATSMVTVTATSGALQQTAKISLTVL